jgi:hypothetical protein
VDWFFTKLNRKLDLILGQLQIISNVQTMEDTAIMATLQDITAAVAAEATVEQGVIVLLGQLTAAVQAAVASSDPTQLQAVLDSITAQTAALSAAVTANTPAPAPAPAP